MATITLELSEDQLAKFREPASLLGITPEELAQRSVGEILDRTNEEFERIVARILKEDDELLRRLAR